MCAILTFARIEVQLHLLKLTLQPMTLGILGDIESRLRRRDPSRSICSSSSEAVLDRASTSTLFIPRARNTSVVPWAPRQVPYLFNAPILAEEQPHSSIPHARARAIFQSSFNKSSKSSSSQPPLRLCTVTFSASCCCSLTASKMDLSCASLTFWRS